MYKIKRFSSKATKLMRSTHDKIKALENYSNQDIIHEIKNIDKLRSNLAKYKPDFRKGSTGSSSDEALKRLGRKHNSKGKMFIKDSPSSDILKYITDKSRSRVPSSIDQKINMKSIHDMERNLLKTKDPRNSYEIGRIDRNIQAIQRRGIKKD